MPAHLEAVIAEDTEPCGDGISIVVPTFHREQVLLETIAGLLSQTIQPREILILDQSSFHEAKTSERLQSWHDSGDITWIRLTKPSITCSMNMGLRAASSCLVLFLDDDIIPSKTLIESHHRAHDADPELWATVGQVIQPWQNPTSLNAPRNFDGLRSDFDFPFHSTIDQDVVNVMAGNLCVNRQRALSLGGFDENFQGSAFRFETEFARRIITAGGSIRFLGSAGIKHLRVPSGGTRKEGSHLTSASPSHGIGDHYYAFLHGGPVEKWLYSMHRVFREVCTKFHATHPWWIPVKLVGELRAMWGGWRMAAGKKREARSERLGARR